MLHSCVISLFLLLATLPVPTASSDTPKSLQFGSTLDDYVKFSPDMSRVKSAHTLCAWVKKTLSGTTRSWLTYTTSTHGYELLISDAGNYNYIHSLNYGVSGLVTVPLNTWTHQCQTWSTSTGEIRVYYNGTLIGTNTFSDRAPLEEGGYILLGHDSGSRDSSEVFGGKLLKLNVFGRVLTDEEIAGMYAAGMCSEVEKNYDDVRYITWERILRETKTGNVSEVESGCPAPVEEEECICPSYSMWDVLLEEKYLNQNLTEEKLTELKSTWTILDNFVESTITGGIITHFKTYHPKAGLGCPVSEEEGEEGEEKEEEEEEDCACPAHSMWDVLMEEKYLNQNLTEDKLTELKSAWTILDHFVGTTITKGIIAHLKMFHPKASGGCETEPDS